ncbi:GAF domain-containing protein [Leifsonia shinshuensis]|uniref:GAF domain-containing protein n=1 Tax=Leifsonia shinshuensis TaxID=150026 RepID=UPI0028609782|nr:GAF domain-containing protein [Leifsonia shinshuensis]MDR6972163.1 GAF domain-containing protein [Leifsonia shinshuensis]
MDDDRVSLPRRARMLAWRARVAAVRNRLVRPVGERQAFAAGRRALRVLLVGSGPVVGWGVGSHDLALPGGLARALAAATDRGAVVDVVPHPSAGVRRLGRLLDAAGPERYDAVVLSATIPDAIRMAEPARWETHLRSLLTRAHTAERTVIWLGAQPIRSIRSYDSAAGAIAQEHAERLNAIARRVCRETGTHFVPLGAPPRGDSGRHRTPADYLFWARQIADVLAPALQEHAVRRADPAVDASDRVGAIERLKLSGRRGDARLDEIVGTAKRTLGTDIAMFTVLDDQKEWPLASTGSVLQSIPIEQSACIHTIQTADGMVVPNAVEDGRFAGSSLVTGPAGLRYYAGYPVEAPDGTRIGALCVFGRSPREREEGEADLDVLRELALLAQRELWRWSPDS